MQRMVGKGYIQLGRKLLLAAIKREQAEYLFGRRDDRKDTWKTHKGQ